MDRNLITGIKPCIHLILCYLAVVGLLSACSGVKVYPNTLTKNLFITTGGEFGGLLTDLVKTVDIYKIDSKCKIKYQGTVKLDQPVNEVGIPVGQYSYLDFKFELDAIVGNRTLTYDTLIRPRFGYHYDIDVSYTNGKEKVTIYEIKRNSSKRKGLMRIRLEDC